MRCFKNIAQLISLPKKVNHLKAYSHNLNFPICLVTKWSIHF